MKLPVHGNRSMILSAKPNGLDPRMNPNPNPHPHPNPNHLQLVGAQVEHAVGEHGVRDAVGDRQVLDLAWV